ncbi:MAG TPA: SDR family NAD(P)-dependent oxidoreductase [Candidatus Bathyarchaeia archaeon]|nr:SDR family NAD(P)-dependent oxidoreductase [Candidatus Bathyarchaeia archaeon]
MDKRMAIVTGAGSGIGRAIALALAAKGSPVAVMDLDGASAEATAGQIKKAGGQASAFQGDTSKAEELNRAVSGAIAALGPLEIMVNNAGILDGYFNVDEIDEKTWRRVIDIDLTGVFLGCKRALAEMLPRGRGRIVNMASVAGLNGTGGGAAYVAAKHGVVGLTRQMAVTYSSRGVTINAICPGPILTDLRRHSQAILGPDVPDMSNRGVAVSEEQIRAIVPAGRRGTVEDIASAVCYLASEEAGYITGHTMLVDGGWRAK